MVAQKLRSPDDTPIRRCFDERRCPTGCTSWPRDNGAGRGGISVYPLRYSPPSPRRILHGNGNNMAAPQQRQAPTTDCLPHHPPSAPRLGNRARGDTQTFQLEPQTLPRTTLPHCRYRTTGQKNSLTARSPRGTRTHRLSGRERCPGFGDGGSARRITPDPVNNCPRYMAEGNAELQPTETWIFSRSLSGSQGVL